MTLSHNVAFCCQQIDKTFDGFYELILYSKEFGETKIIFSINVFDQSLTTSDLPCVPTILSSATNDLAVMIVLSIAVVFSISSVVLLIANRSWEY